MPKYCTIPLRNDNNVYRQTIDAIQYIISHRLDQWLLFDIDFYNPVLGLQQNRDFYTATHIRKQPIVPVEVLDNIKRTIRQGGKFTDEHLFLRVSCRNAIKNLSLRYHNGSSQSESQKSNDIMANKTTRTTKPPAVPATETHTPPSAVTPKEEPTVTAVVVKDPIAAAFISPKELIQADITKISAYKAITTSAEAEGLNSVMKDLNEKKKLVDKIHKQGKEPSLNESRKWDAAKKEILDGTEVALAEAKSLLYAWDIAQREVQAEAQRKADLERKKLDDVANAEATRISNIKIELDAFEQAIAKKIIEAPSNPALYEIWTNDLAPFLPSEQSHGVFAQHAMDMKARLERLGKACSAKIQATNEYNANQLTIEARNQIHESSDVILREYSFVRDQAMQQVAIVASEAVEEATIASEVAKSTITGQQIMQQEKPMLNYRRTWRWEVQDINEVDPAFKIQHPGNYAIYLEVDGKFIPTYLPMGANVGILCTLNDAAIKSWVEKENASSNPLVNGECHFGLAFYVEETPVMPRS